MKFLKIVMLSSIILTSFAYAIDCSREDYSLTFEKRLEQFALCEKIVYEKSKKFTDTMMGIAPELSKDYSIEKASKHCDSYAKGQHNYDHNGAIVKGCLAHWSYTYKEYLNYKKSASVK